MDKDQWEEKYSTASVEEIPAPAALLRTHSDLLSGGRALDIAMGPGHNAALLASRGYAVTGVDRSATAVRLAREHARQQSVSINAVETDISSYPIPENSFDLITNFYFLERPIVPEIKKGLKQNGLVFFETYTAAPEGTGGPKNPDFLLKPGELLSLFSDLFIIFYHERIKEGKAIASLIAQKV